MRSRSVNGLMIKLLCERRDRSTTGAEYIAIEEDRRRAIQKTRPFYRSKYSHDSWCFAMDY
jgi:hypothetical protein